MPPLARACCDEPGGSFDECEPAVVAVGMWKSRAFCGISKRGGNGGKVALAFGLFHGFHSASFPQPISGSMLLRPFAVFSPTNSAEEPKAKSLGIKPRLLLNISESRIYET